MTQSVKLKLLAQANGLQYELVNNHMHDCRYPFSCCLSLVQGDISGALDKTQADVLQDENC